MQFGAIVPQQLTAWDELLAIATLVEQTGFDALWAIDHYLPAATATMHGSQFDAWTVLAAWAQATTRVRLGTAVTCNNFRHPALLAKIVATVDHISHGRAILGIGAGWFEQEHRMFGWPYPAAGVRLAMLDEAVQVIKACWTAERPVFHGRHYTLDFAGPAGVYQNGEPVPPASAPGVGPRPVQQPHPPLSVGGTGERRTLRTVAAHADDWNVIGPAALIREKSIVLARHCQELGRDPATIRRSTVLPIYIEDDAAKLADALTRRAARAGVPVAELQARMLAGSGSQIIEQVQAFAAVGISNVILQVGPPYHPAVIERIARDVIEPWRKAEAVA